MRYFTGLILFLFTLSMHAMASAAETSPLKISVRCLPVSGCIYIGKPIDIVISITNTSNEEVGLTRKYLQQVGPYVTLIDVETKRERSLYVGLGHHALLATFKPLAPGASLTFEIEITAFEITSFQKEFVDLDVKVAFDGNKKIGSRSPEPIDEVAYFKIVEPDILKRHSGQGKDEDPAVN